GGRGDGFAGALTRAAGAARPEAASVGSDESAMYRPEMEWLADALHRRGLPCQAVAPAALRVEETGVTAGGARLDVVYRFFELFDLAGVPGGEALLEAAKLKRVRVTPPPKAFLEEKVLFALLHHPALTPWWEAELGERTLGELRALVVPTWLLDPAPVPPHAAIAGFAPGGRAVQSWDALAAFSQKERAYVIKPSGFAEDAWGSHGVRFGSDLSQEDWTKEVRAALDAFPARPRVLQPYAKPARVRVGWYDPAADAVREFEGRARLCPYYFVTGESETALGGVLATICPADKKAIHGMPDAVMAPAAD
ncbi:MAG: hypothetical protein AAB368_16890, partial [bacterium]